MALPQEQYPESFKDMQQRAMGSLAQPNMSTQPTNRRLSLSQAQIPVAGRPISCLRTPVNFRVNHRLPVSRSAATLERSEVQRPSSEGLDRYQASVA